MRKRISIFTNFLEKLKNNWQITNILPIQRIWSRTNISRVDLPNISWINLSVTFNRWQFGSIRIFIGSRRIIGWMMSLKYNLNIVISRKKHAKSSTLHTSVSCINLVTGFIDLFGLPEVPRAPEALLTLRPLCLVCNSFLRAFPADRAELLV